MAVQLNCRDLGADCDHFVNGESVDEIVGEMQQHAMTTHGYPESQVMSDEMVATMRGAVKQSSRPDDQRTSRIEFE